MTRLSSDTEFCLLGPLLVRSGDDVMPIRKGKLRALLAALLLSANTVVSVDELTEALWGLDPPATARAVVQTYVMQLRRTLGAAGTRIGTQAHGYLIRVQSGELDVAQFEALVTQARAASRNADWAQAGSRAGAALSLWRGAPLADTGSHLLASCHAPRLAELRLQALEARIDADIHSGRHGDVIGELRQLSAADPLRERLHALLMLALYLDGRQGEALAAYRRARGTLVDELGAEPGPDLQALHRQILTADPALSVAELAITSASAGAPAVPRELPAPPSHFTGRAAELAALTGLIREPGSQPSAVVISAIGGTPGVGKTALALRWAHEVACRFPGGQLYVNLRGYDPDQPMPATDALAGFLTSLGVPGHDIPATIEERAARYRSLLAGKQVLIVLDNAGTVEQVRPLLPGNPGCAVVVTSRDALAGLVARDGAARINLDLLPAHEAVGLLSAMIGPRVDEDPAAADALAERCARLPLALRVAAELAAGRPGVPLAWLAAELADRDTRLDQLEAGGDNRTAVRAVFSWSYRNLDPAAARAFRLAGLHPGASFEAYVIAALCGTTLSEARRHLHLLVRAHLVQPAAAGRHGMHDLLRGYARELAATEDSPDERGAALTRLFDYFLHGAATAMNVFHPARQHRRPRVLAAATPSPSFGDAAAALSWLDTEQANLLAIVVAAADGGFPGHATRIAATLHSYLQSASSPHEVSFHSIALRAAWQLGDDAAAAQALLGLGSASWRLGRCASAAEELGQALNLFRAADDKAGQARALNNLGGVSYQQASYREAADYFGRSLDLFRQTCDLPGEAAALNGIGNALQSQGQDEQAATSYQESLRLARELGDRQLEIVALGNLGLMAHKVRDYQAADGYNRQAVALSRETGDRSGEATALNNLGATARLDGRYEQAVSYHKQAIGLFRETGAQADEADVLIDLGEAFLAADQPADARAQLAMALDITRRIGHRYYQARAHHALGNVHVAADRIQAARDDLQQALSLYRAMGAPEAEQVSTLLADLNAVGPQSAMRTAGVRD